MGAATVTTLIAWPATAATDGQDPGEAVVVQRTAQTTALHQYDDAPRTPDADDPAIWLPRDDDDEALVVTVLKEAGLQVVDLDGEVVQTVLPHHRPPVGADDPPTVGTQPEAGTSACPGSESGETYSRYNNVDISRDVRVRSGRGWRTTDVAVVTDRGCDQLRVFEIDPDAEGGPLVDITADEVPQVFPQRWVTPYPYTEGDASPRTEASNPVDDEATSYGVTLYQPKEAKGAAGAREGTVRAFVTQAASSVVGEVELVPTADGRMTYRRTTELHLDPVFDVGSAGAATTWTPCREDPAESPQLEGLVVDPERGVLHAAQEDVGLWTVPLREVRGRTADIGQRRLTEPVTTFGEPWWASPEDDEYTCSDEPTEGEGVIAGTGAEGAGGAHLQPDAEGLALYRGEDDDEGYLIASSQGDDTFHLFDRDARGRHRGSFTVEDGGETDGHEVTAQPAGPGFESGLFVAQSGEAPAPADISPINGYDYDGSTQFVLLPWESVAEPLDLEVAADD